VTERWGFAVGAVLMDSGPEQAFNSFRLFEGWAAEALGPAHPAVAQAVARQAWCQARLGKLRESCDLYRRALDMLEASVGTEHIASRRLASYLATACSDGSGRPSGTGQSAPPRRLEGLLPFNPLASSGSPTRELDGEQERLEAAARQIGLSGLVAGGTPPDSQGYMVGTALAEIGEFDLAAKAFELYQRWASQEYGSDHDYVLQAVNQLAYCHLRLGNYTESCQLYDRARQILERTRPGDPSIRTLADRIDARCPPAHERWFFGIGTRLAAEGRFEDAIGAFDAYQRWAAGTHGPRHKYVAHAVAVQANCYAQVGQPEVACMLYRRALGLAPFAGFREELRAEMVAYVDEHCKEGGGGDSELFVKLGDTWAPPSLHRIEPELGQVGDALISSGHPDEALSALDAHEAWIVRQSASDDPRLGPVLARKARCHAELGHDQEACRLYELARRYYPPEDAFSREVDEYLAENCRS